MKKHLIALLLCLAAPALAADGDILFSYKTSNGLTNRVIAPGTGTEILALNGSGLITKLARSTFEPAISNGSLPLSKLAITGTANSSTFVRGDGSWATISSGSAFTSALSTSANGASGSPAFSLTGSAFTGGTGTTTKPLALIEPSGTASTTWSTNGTQLGINAVSAFAGDLMAAKIADSTRFSISGGNSPALTLRDSGGVTFTVTRTTGVHAVLAVNSAGMGFSGGGGLTLLNWDSNWQLASTAQFGWSSGAAGLSSNANDVRLTRSVAGVLALESISAGAAIQLREMTAPSAPATDRARLWVEDNGSGKSRLMVQFGSGAAQQIAIEP